MTRQVPGFRPRLGRWPVGRQRTVRRLDWWLVQAAQRVASFPYRAAPFRLGNCPRCCAALRGCRPSWLCSPAAGANTRGSGVAAAARSPGCGVSGCSARARSGGPAVDVAASGSPAKVSTPSGPYPTSWTFGQGVGGWPRAGHDWHACRASSNGAWRGTFRTGRPVPRRIKGSVRHNGRKQRRRRIVRRRRIPRRRRWSRFGGPGVSLRGPPRQSRGPVPGRYRRSADPKGRQLCAAGPAAVPAPVPGRMASAVSLLRASAGSGPAGEPGSSGAGVR